MLWTIIKKELLLNLMTFKFAVGTAVCVVLTAIFVPVLLKDYEIRMEQYSAGVANNQAELQKVKAYKNITPTVWRRSSPLSVFAQGYDKRLRHDVPIRFERIPTLQTGLAEDNPFLVVFPTMDVALLFKIVVSILALLVAHDTISGERENGTLSLMLSTSIPRYRILLAKSIAGLSSVAIPVSLAFIAAGFWLECSPSIRVTGADWIRIGLIYGVSLLFVFVMFATGLLASCLAKKSAVALILGLFCWVWFVVIVPNGSVSLAAQTGTVESLEKRDARIQAIHQEQDQERSEHAEQRMRHSENSTEDRSRFAVSNGIGAFGRSYAELVSKAYLPERIELHRIRILMGLKYADKIHQVENDYTRELLKQRQLALLMSRFSPACLYGSVLSTLAGTDINHQRDFLDYTRIYRRQIVDYIRSHTDSFTAPSLITVCPEQDMIETGDRYVELRLSLKGAKGKDQIDQIIDKWKKYVEVKSARQSSLDLKDMPAFNYRPSITASLQWAAWDLTLMILMGIILWTTSLVLFHRYDIRTD